MEDSETLNETNLERDSIEQLELKMFAGKANIWSEARRSNVRRAMSGRRVFSVMPVLAGQEG